MFPELFWILLQSKVSNEAVSDLDSDFRRNDETNLQEKSYILFFHLCYEVFSCLNWVFTWLIEEDADRHFRELETIKEAFTVWHISISYSDDISLIPFTVLNTVIGWAELENFYISKAWVTESFLKHFRHMIHIIRERTGNKRWIAT